MILFSIFDRCVWFAHKCYQKYEIVHPLICVASCHYHLSTIEVIFTNSLLFQNPLTMVEIMWLGQACFYIRCNGTSVVLDPYFQQEKVRIFV